ncbi:MAG: replication-relaxation family protein [Paracoccaceae bacterium]
MFKGVDLSVTHLTVAALSAICAYRYLSVNQVATIVGVRPKSASEMLLRLERAKLLGSFGNTGIRGYGKTPKIYFITKRGHSVLAEELEAEGQTVPAFKPINITSRWSPLMFHRVDTLDVLAAVERDCARMSEYRLAGTLVEYRREKIGTRWRKETTNYVSSTQTPENKIVPDAGFAVENLASGKRALFLIEVDCGTTRLTTKQTDNDIATFTNKLAQYDRYLASGLVADRHARLGKFNGFHLLVVTTTDQRVANMRNAAAKLSPDFHQFYRFSTLNAVRQNLLHDGWLSRDHADHSKYSLLKGS